MHTIELGAGHIETARLRAGRKQEPSPAEPFSIGEHYLLRCRIDAPDLGRGPEFDLVAFVEPVRMNPSLLAWRLAAQIFLRERRPLVGKLSLGSQQDDSTLKAFVPQALGRLGSRQSGSDDDVGSAVTHGVAFRSGKETHFVFAGRRGRAPAGLR